MAVVVLFVSIVLLLVVCSAEQSLFTLSYAAPNGHPQLVNADTPLKTTTPDSLHVADLYARIAGHVPLLLEGIHFYVWAKFSVILTGETFSHETDKVNMPAVDILTKRTKSPLIVELHSNGM